MRSLARVRPSSQALIAAAACWGVGSVVSKRAVEEIDPLVLLPIELAVSAAVLTLITWRTGGLAALSRSSRDAGRTRAAALGLLNPGLAYALGLAGLATVSASVSVLLWALEPLVILLLAWLLAAERPRGDVLRWSAAAVAGAALVLAQPGGASPAAGVALILAAVAACGVYSVLSGRLGLELSAPAVVVLQQLAALAFSLVVLVGGVAWRGWPSLARVSAGAWASAALAGVLYYGLAFWLYLLGLRQIGPVRAGVFINLVPLFGLAAGAAVLGERLAPRQWAGAAVIVVAVVAVTRVGPTGDPS